MKLNRTKIELDRTARNNENENWQKIENQNKNLQKQIDTLVLESGDSSPEVAQARIGIDGHVYTTLKERLDTEQEEVNHKIDNNHQEVTSQLAQMTTVTKEQESAPLGEELVSPTGWVIGAGWTGDYATGFTHTPDNTSSLSYPLNAQANKLYQVTLTVEDIDTMNSGFKFKVTVGNSEPFEMYQGTGSVITYSRGIKAVENGDLKIIPDSDFTGTIKNISVKEIIGTIPPTTVIFDENKNVVFESRPTKEELDNIFEGKNAGQYNTSGHQNTIIGNNAMENNTSGFWNSALGQRALMKNTVGSRNMAIGARSLENNISGHRNIAVGTFALHRMTTGAYNIGIGADAGWHTTTGNYNIAIGTVSLDKNESGSGNIAIGYNALRDNVDTSYNIGIGHWALRENKAHNNTAVGTRALTKNITGEGNTAFGYESLRESTGQHNTAIGQWAGSQTSGSRNVFVGRRAGVHMQSGNDNILIGNNVGVGLTGGNSNILIGHNIEFDNESKTNYMNIGNVIYGQLGNRLVGIRVENPTARLHVAGGTAGTPSVKLEPGTLTTTLHPGSFEYDGTNLYFTVPGKRINLTNQ